MTRTGTRFAAMLAAVGLWLVGAATAHADGPARCSVREISAQPGEGGVDPALGDLAAQLTRPPFTAWKSFKLVGREEATLTEGASASFALPDGGQGTLTYKQHVKEGARHRVRLQLEVKRGDKTQVSTVFVLDEGGTVLNAGYKHQAGILILGVTCRTSS